MCERTLIINADVAASDSIKTGYGLFINQDGRIADVFCMDDLDKAKYGKDVVVMDAEGRLLAPGLVDTHIHGIHGFATDDAQGSSILGMSEALARYGVTSFLPTLYAGRPDKMVREISAIVEVIGKEKGARIAGIHLEGPFLNPKKAGAQEPESLSNPSTAVMQKFIDAGKGYIRAMTIAPELPGVEEVAKLAKANGIVLLMGHTNATYQEAKAGMELGILHATHMFNAMSPLNHKNPGVAGASLMDSRMHCEIIADGVHVNKDLVMHVIRTKAKDRVVLITDSLGPTGLGNGKYRANGDDVCLGEIGAFVNASNPELLCGSALTLNKAVSNVVAWGTEVPQALRMASENPARVYGFTDIGLISKGARADLVLFDKDFRPVEVFVDGQKLAI